MRAKLTTAKAPAGREWIIVSRWGDGGDHLSIARTFVAATEGLTLQGWLQLDRNNLEGTILALPTREDVQIPVEENLIVEFCSR